VEVQEFIETIAIRAKDIKSVLEKKLIFTIIDFVASKVHP